MVLTTEFLKKAWPQKPPCAHEHALGVYQQAFYLYEQTRDAYEQTRGVCEQAKGP